MSHSISTNGVNMTPLVNDQSKQTQNFTDSFIFLAVAGQLQIYFDESMFRFHIIIIINIIKIIKQCNVY